MIYFACDHAALELKNTLIHIATEHGNHCKDLGAHTTDSVDYPDMADNLAKALINAASQEDDAIGVLLCGSGIGISIAANRYSHIRAALCHNTETATLARQHNDANVLVLGARILSEQEAIDCLNAFLNTPFEGGRHQGRVDKLSAHGEK